MITDYVSEKKRMIESHLDRLIPKRDCAYVQLIESARYALLGEGGKRLRPILAIAAYEMFGGTAQKILTAACALEFIHTYSMIHDDLPCMDNDDYRRGRLTVHRQFSEEIAVLAGDYLLTFAFEILADDPFLESDQKLKLISILSKQSGCEGMLGGQVMDLDAEGKKIGLETLQQLHKQKTAALIKASIQFGGIIGNANNHEMELITQFGDQLGMTFQIVDDILDVTHSKSKHGKDISSDLLNEKSTYVTLLGIEEAKNYAMNCYRNGLSILDQLPHDTTILKKIAEMVIDPISLSTISR